MAKPGRKNLVEMARTKERALQALLGRALWEQGLRYRRSYGELNVDFAFPSERIAVVLAPCALHGCPEHRVDRALSVDASQEIVASNQEEAQDAAELLRRKRWKVIRLWEHDLERDLDACVGKVVAAVNERVHDPESWYLGAGKGSHLHS